MQLNTLKPKTSRTTARRVGRGGKRGKTSGRGTKGQKARAGHKIRPEMRDIIKKLPKRRGHGKNRSRTVRQDRRPYAVVNLTALNEAFAAGERVTPAALRAKGLIRTLRATAGVKVLGTGELSKALVFDRVTVSATAKKAIEAAGGTLPSHA